MKQNLLLEKLPELEKQKIQEIEERSKFYSQNQEEQAQNFRNGLIQIQQIEQAELERKERQNQSAPGRQREKKLARCQKTAYFSSHDLLKICTLCTHSKLGSPDN